MNQAADSPSGEEEGRTPMHFIEQIIHDDLAANKNGGRLHMRFPPEPNGYLHIGHAKAICVSFGLAQQFGGQCHLRFDDTNPSKEEQRFVDSIQEDIRWLGFDWGEHLHFTSDYFGQLYEWAQMLVKKGKAYVCDLTAEQTREYRGSLTSPGKNSEYRDRSVEENLDLLERMKKGEFEDGSRVLRAKIDMASPNLNMRDPVLYRVMRATHHRTGDDWCIYPMYDFAHGQSDAIEKITHSCCSLEFENHRPLYDWFLQELEIEDPPHQYEFARLALTYTLMSKRSLRQLVEENYVAGWDDPRMPTLSGMRRRGMPPEAIRNFCKTIGVAKFNSTVDMVVLENSVREQLNKSASRYMGVLEPLKLIIENYPEGQSEQLVAVNNPEDESAGTREIPFSKELFIEREDFKEEANRKYFRLKPGQEVRLRYAYYVTCTGFDKDPETGEILAVRCNYDPESKGGRSEDGRKVKGTIHWVSAEHALTPEVNIYDHLFNTPNPAKCAEGETFLDHLNPESLKVITDAKIEPALAQVPIGESFQLERKGYFCMDLTSKPEQLILNRTVALRDSWAKIEKQSAPQKGQKKGSSKKKEPKKN